MKQIKGWWFGTTDKKLLNGDGRKIVIGETHKLKGEIIPCVYGLHLSERIIDALQYAPGPVVYRVVGSGIIVPHGSPVDKYACSERTYVSGGIDISDILRLFARQCALSVIHLWNPPEIVVRYIKTGDESIRTAARGAAWAAAWDAAWAAAAWDAARDAAWAAAAWDAARRDAAWDAAWAAAAGNAARDAAWAAARAVAAGDAVITKFNKKLTSMVNKIIA